MPRWLLACLLLLSPLACDDDNSLADEDTEETSDSEVQLTEEQLREALLSEPIVTGTPAVDAQADRDALYPLPIIEGATRVNIHHTDRPDGGKSSHLALVARKPIEEVAEFYVSAMRARGYSVRRNDTVVRGDRQISLLGTSTSAEVTALISQGMREEHPRVSMTWESRTSTAPATATHPG